MGLTFFFGIVTEGMTANRSHTTCEIAGFG